MSKKDEDFRVSNEIYNLQNKLSKTHSESQILDMIQVHIYLGDNGSIDGIVDVGRTRIKEIKIHGIYSAEGGKNKKAKTSDGSHVRTEENGKSTKFIAFDTSRGKFIAPYYKCHISPDNLPQKELDKVGVIKGVTAFLKLVKNLQHLIFVGGIVGKKRKISELSSASKLGMTEREIFEKLRKISRDPKIINRALIMISNKLDLNDLEKKIEKLLKKGNFTVKSSEISKFVQNFEEFENREAKEFQKKEEEVQKEEELKEKKKEEELKEKKKEEELKEKKKEEEELKEKKKEENDELEEIEGEGDEEEGKIAKDKGERKGERSPVNITPGCFGNALIDSLIVKFVADRDGKFYSFSYLIEDFKDYMGVKACSLDFIYVNTKGRKKSRLVKAPNAFLKVVDSSEKMFKNSKYAKEQRKEAWYHLQEIVNYGKEKHSKTRKELKKKKGGVEAMPEELVVELYGKRQTNLTKDFCIRILKKCYLTSDTSAIAAILYDKKKLESCRDRIAKLVSEYESRFNSISNKPTYKLTIHCSTKKCKRILTLIKGIQKLNLVETKINDGSLEIKFCPAENSKVILESLLVKLKKKEVCSSYEFAVEEDTNKTWYYVSPRPLLVSDEVICFTLEVGMEFAGRIFVYCDESNVVLQCENSLSDNNLQKLKDEDPSFNFEQTGELSLKLKGMKKYEIEE